MAAQLPVTEQLGVTQAISAKTQVLLLTVQPVVMVAEAVIPAQLLLAASVATPVTVVMVQPGVMAAMRPVA